MYTSDELVSMCHAVGLCIASSLQTHTLLLISDTRLPSNRRLISTFNALLFQFNRGSSL